MKRLIAVPLLAALCTVAGAPAASAAPITPVASVEVAKYLGTWKQLASIPQWFEALCLRNTTANYRLNPNGTVRVVNRCAGPLGLPITVAGTARIADRTTNAQLEVTFLNIGGPIFTGVNYVIIGLASDYSWAIVADPDRTSAFVLSRTATQSTSVMNEIRAVLVRNQINPCRLRITKQAGGATTSPSLC